jgi:hypothetical protein
MRASHDFSMAYMIENTATQIALGSSRTSKAMNDSFHELYSKIGFLVVLDAAMSVVMLIACVTTGQILFLLRTCSVY